MGPRKNNKTANNPLNKNGHINMAILNCIYQNALEDTSFHSLASDLG